VIELHKLTCNYDKRIILQNINIKINSHISILGANGSGKSTLAKAICNMIAYTGNIIIDGQNIQLYTPKEKAKKIAYIPTKLAIYDEFLTLEDFVLLGRFAHKKNFFDYSAQDKKIAEEKMAFFNLIHLKKHPLVSLSSGETALALMAQALTQESEIIIFDEPTANLDPKNSKIIASHIKKLKQTHQTILITHDIHLARFIDNHVLFLQEKQVFYFENNFFTDENLSRLYGVRFSSLEIQYE
jgi:iron complex transport system ATP-binding protein